MKIEQKIETIYCDRCRSEIILPTTYTSNTIDYIRFGKYDFCVKCSAELLSKLFIDKKITENDVKDYTKDFTLTNAIISLY